MTGIPVILETKAYRFLIVWRTYNVIIKSDIGSNQYPIHHIRTNCHSLLKRQILLAKMLIYILSEELRGGEHTEQKNHPFPKKNAYLTDFKRHTACDNFIRANLDEKRAAKLMIINGFTKVFADLDYNIKRLVAYHLR